MPQTADSQPFWTCATLSNHTQTVESAISGPEIRLRHLEENAGAVDVKLSDDDMARLEAALRPEAVSGPRYNEKLIAWVDR